MYGVTRHYLDNTPHSLGRFSKQIFARQRGVYKTKTPCEASVHGKGLNEIFPKPRLWLCVRAPTLLWRKSARKFNRTGHATLLPYLVLYGICRPKKQRMRSYQETTTRNRDSVKQSECRHAANVSDTPPTPAARAASCGRQKL